MSREATVTQRLLIIGSETPALQRIAPILRRAEFETRLAANADQAFELLEDVAFDLIVLRYPVPGLSLHEFVDRVRTVGSLCRTAGLVLLAEPTCVGEVARLLGKGVNRVVSLDASSDRLLDAIADLLAVDPRRTVRAVIQLELWVERAPERVLTLTENVSTAGMLVRGGSEFPLGTRLQFELMLPGERTPVRGQLEVARHTDPGRERVEGFGGKVVSYAGDGQERVRAFIAQRSSRPV